MNRKMKTIYEFGYNVDNDTQSRLDCLLEAVDVIGVDDVYEELKMVNETDIEMLNDALQIIEIDEYEFKIRNIFEQRTCLLKRCSLVNVDCYVDACMETFDGKIPEHNEFVVLDADLATEIEKCCADNEILKNAMFVQASKLDKRIKSFLMDEDEDYIAHMEDFRNRKQDMYHSVSMLEKRDIMKVRNMEMHRRNVEELCTKIKEQMRLVDGKYLVDMINVRELRLNRIIVMGLCEEFLRELKEFLGGC